LQFVELNNQEYEVSEVTLHFTIQDIQLL